MFYNFLVLNLVNYLCDYPLQGAFLAEWKQKNNYILFVHSFIWAAGIVVALKYLGLFAWWKFIMLFIGHLLMDGWKCRGYYKRLNISDMGSLYIDQAFHLLQIGACLL